MLNGILNIYKEKGFTSHNVVAKLRGITKQKKIGHTGTLDPDAEGVLPVCLGRATKVCALLTEKDKIYETTLLLGKTTDTQDISGTVLKERDTKGLTEQDVRKCIDSYVGTYDQLPPMYSALKVNGKKLYELARAGVEVERKRRRVTVYEIEVTEVRLPRIQMRVHCSKGTYIRTLCHDIGESLGCGGCMETLLRTKVSCFSLEDSLRLSEIERLSAEETGRGSASGGRALFSEYPKLTLRKGKEAKAYNGNPFGQEELMEDPGGIQDGEPVRIYDVQGQFVGIFRCRMKGQQNGVDVREEMMYGISRRKDVFDAGVEEDGQKTDMQYITEIESYQSEKRSAVTLGKFDGLHRGHQKLIERVRDHASDETVSIVCSFDMGKDMLLTETEKRKRLEPETDVLIFTSFHERIRQMEPETFIKEVLVERLQAAYVVVGTDFCFGHEKRGNVEMLRQYADVYGYRLEVVDKEVYDGDVISSTRVRKALEAGKIGLANELLGYRYSVSGVVEHGKQLGRRLGFPTMNVAFEERKKAPRFGVYACRVEIDGIWFPGIGNVGVKPTVTEEMRLLAEVFVLGYDGNAYGKQITVELCDFERSEQKFASVG